MGEESAGTVTARTSAATAELIGQQPTVFPSHRPLVERLEPAGSIEQQRQRQRRVAAAAGRERDLAAQQGDDLRTVRVWVRNGPEGYPWCSSRWIAAVAFRVRVRL